MICFIIINRFSCFAICCHDDKLLSIFTKRLHVKGYELIRNLIENKIHAKNFPFFYKICERKILFILYITKVYFSITSFLSIKIVNCDKKTRKYADQMEQVKVFLHE